jgi:uncharacterized protein YbbC (DUF1343 family)
MPAGFSFTPKSLPGVSLHPPYENQRCSGRDLRVDGVNEFARTKGIVLEWLIDAYTKSGRGADFFTGYFDTLAGTDQLRLQIQDRVSPEVIRASWKEGLRKYQEMRSKYFLYGDR